MYTYTFSNAYAWCDGVSMCMYCCVLHGYVCDHGYRISSLCVCCFLCLPGHCLAGLACLAALAGMPSFMAVPFLFLLLFIFTYCSFYCFFLLFFYCFFIHCFSYCSFFTVPFPFLLLFPKTVLKKKLYCSFLLRLCRRARNAHVAAWYLVHTLQHSG